MRKPTAHIDQKALNMRHQPQKRFHGTFVGIPKHQKGYLVYVKKYEEEIYSYDIVLNESFLVR